VGDKPHGIEDELQFSNIADNRQQLAEKSVGELSKSLRILEAVESLHESPGFVDQT
jgi:hypothetical protein